MLSTRLVLTGMGQIDFGLFTLVGSLIIVITYLNSVMSWSASRFFAYSIGNGEPAKVNSWFNAALSIHLCLAIILTATGWPLGEIVIAHMLTIPADRVVSCLWVFRMSLASAFLSILSVPFIAMFSAKQHISELAIWGMIQSLLAFALALQLGRLHGDRLLFYAFGMVVIFLIVQCLQIFRALIIFQECRIIGPQRSDRNQLIAILSFAFWNLFGSLGTLVRNQGSAILLNFCFGPRVNAGFGIANQASSQTDLFAGAMIGAFTPEITASAGRGDRARMLSLSNRASKLCTILVMLFAIPLMAEIDCVLKIWLGEPPLYTATFCWLILFIFIIDRLTVGHLLAINANGKIAAFQTAVGTSLVLCLPLAYLFFSRGFPPTSITIAYFIVTAASTGCRLFWAWRLFNLSIRCWLTDLLLPCTYVAIAGTLAALGPRLILAASFCRLALVISSSVAGSLITSWFLAFDESERDFVGKNLQILLAGLTGRGARLNNSTGSPSPHF